MRIASIIRGTGLAAGLFGAFTATSARAYDLPPANAEATVDPALQELQAISRATAALAARAKKALVFISVSKAAPGRQSGPGGIDPFDFFFGPQGPGSQGPDPRGPKGGGAPQQAGVGSGFLVDVEKGYAITNNHVVEGAEEIELKLASGEIRKAKVIGRDDRTDVAVVQVLGEFDKKPLEALRLGNSDAMSVGDFVVALGAPFGLEASLSQGVVSATGRGNLDIAQLGDFIQTDAAINPGNSGGPLLNAAGEVVGMNTAIFSRSGSYAGIGFAVPASIVRTVAEQLIDGGKIERGFVGLSLQEIRPDIAQGLALPEGTHGAIVAQVQNGSPAAKAGIEAGDVIVKLNERGVSSVSQVTNTIGLMKPGSELRVAVIRNGKERQLGATVGTWPRDGRLVSDTGRTNDDRSGASPEYSAFGLAVAPLDLKGQTERQLESKAGALITGVEPNSQAARVGLRAGDLIVAADNKPVKTANEFESLQQARKRLLLRIERQGDFFFVPLSRS